MASLSDLSVASNQVAQQNNPEYAALNQIVQSRVIPFEGFSDFVHKAIEPEKQRQHARDMLSQQYKYNKKLADDDAKRGQDTYRRNLEDIYQLQLGGKEDVTKMDLNRLRQAIYDRNYDVTTNYGANGQFPLPGSNNISTPITRSANGEYSVPNMQQSSGIYGPQARISQLDIPTLNNSGRIGLEHLRQINKLYPYLSQTDEGRNFLMRLEHAINSNRDNMKALLPFLDEINSGNIPLVAPTREADLTPYKKMRTHEEDLDKYISNSPLNLFGLGRIGGYISTGTDEGVNDAIRTAMKYGYTPTRREEFDDDGMFSGFKRWIRNREEYNKANEYMENFKPTYKFMKERNIDPILPAQTDQYTQQIKTNIAKMLGLSSPQFVQVGRNNFGDLVFVADNQMFTVQDGVLYRMEP